MKPVWVKVGWQVPSIYSGNEFTPVSAVVEKIKELELIEGIYFGNEYTKDGIDFLSIGIQTDIPFRKIEALGTFSFMRSFTEIGNGMWVSCPVYEWNYTEHRYEVTIPSLGINQCGTFMIEGTSLEKDDVNKFELELRSSLLSDLEYNLMKNELLLITEELMYTQHLRDNGSESKTALIDLESVEQTTRNLADLLGELEKAPAESLSQKRVKTKVEKLRKLDVRALLEKELYAMNETVIALEILRSLDIKEHRKLKGAVLEFITICERNRDRERLMKENLTCQAVEISIDKEKVKGTSFHVHFSAKETFLFSQMNMMAVRLDSWNRIIGILEDMLESELIRQCSPEDWGETHLFIYHPEYGQAFELVELLQKELRQDNLPLKSFQRDLLHSPDLYEKWILLKVIHHFTMDLKFTPRYGNVMKQILVFYQQNKTLREFKVELMHSHYFSLTIGSEVNFNGLRPDISLFLVDRSQRVLAFLDAKYKPYSRMPLQLETDLARSAKRYREMDSRGETAFLVHPDIDLGSDFERLRPHKDGYFLLKPGKEEGLSLFSKMAMHFHLGWEKVCPDCGERHSITEDIRNEKKSYFTCGNCNSFWVRSSCWNRNHFVTQRLFKYLNRNYHRSTIHDWDVHCPRCGLTAADYKRGMY